MGLVDWNCLVPGALASGAGATSTSVPKQETLDEDLETASSDTRHNYGKESLCFRLLMLTGETEVGA